MCSMCAALSAWGKTSLTRCAMLDQNYFEFRGQRVRVLSMHVTQGRFGGTPAESPSLTREELRWSVGRPVPTCRRRRLFWIVFVSTTTRNCPRPNSVDIGLDISNQRFDLSILYTGHA